MMMRIAPLLGHLWVSHDSRRDVAWKCDAIADERWNGFTVPLWRDPHGMADVLTEILCHRDDPPEHWGSATVTEIDGETVVAIDYGPSADPEVIRRADNGWWTVNGWTFVEAHRWEWSDTLKDRICLTCDPETDEGTGETHPLASDFCPQVRMP